jgi:ABC-type dipeptide/oligopeptide/nickel transport system permease component
VVVSEGQLDAPRPQGQWARIVRARMLEVLEEPWVRTARAMPGLGRTLIRALAGFLGYDLPVILAVTMVTAAAIILLNLLADLLLLALDPTVSRQARVGRVS